MPFNERGEWVDMNPLDTYNQLVKKSMEQPGSGGYAWSSSYRNKLHNNATLFVMNIEGIPFTPENFARVRERIGREVEEFYNIDKENGFVNELALPPLQVQLAISSSYKRIGD